MGKYSWLRYMFERLDGFAPVDSQSYAAGRTSALGGLGEYGDLGTRAHASARLDRTRPVMACVAPVSYSNPERVRRDIANLRRAVATVQVNDAFLPAPAPAPGTVATQANRYYASDEEYLFAVADAMRVEYQTIVEAGSIGTRHASRSGEPARVPGNLTGPHHLDTTLETVQLTRAGYLHSCPTC
jgi:5-methyltetrahydropteroyltriglutamate--homocysteine methyltransferase